MESQRLRLSPTVRTHADVYCHRFLAVRTLPRRRRTSVAGEDSALPWWTRHATPTYLNFRKASIYGGSNEVQRQIISRNILGL